MQTQRPEVLLAMGSYASVGPVGAARWIGVPYVLHEANVVVRDRVAFRAVLDRDLAHIWRAHLRVVELKALDLGKFDVAQ